MRLLDTITDIIEGIKALPACAEAVRELVEFSRESSTEAKRLQDELDEARDDRAQFLQQRDEQIVRADMLQRKLDYLLRPRKQGEEPCLLESKTRVFWAEEPNRDWYGAEAGEFRCFQDPDAFWRPVDLTHFEE